MGMLVLAAMAIVLACASIPSSANAGFAGSEQVSQSAVNGNGADGANFAGNSADGSRVFFQTDEQLAVTDTDGSGDTYMREGGTTTHVSQGQVNGNGVFSAQFEAASADGARALFTSDEQLTLDDTDSVEGPLRARGSDDHQDLA